MFAIVFDLVVAEIAKAHPKGISQAYAGIGTKLAQFGFEQWLDVTKIVTS